MNGNRLDRMIPFRSPAIFRSSHESASLDSKWLQTDSEKNGMRYFFTPGYHDVTLAVPLYIKAHRVRSAGLVTNKGLITLSYIGQCTSDIYIALFMYV